MFYLVDRESLEKCIEAENKKKAKKEAADQGDDKDKKDVDGDK